MVAVAVVGTLTAAHFLHRPRKWVLTAPPSAAGLGRDHNSVDQISFGSAVAKFRSSVTSLPAYRHLTSTVSAVYALGSAQAVGFVGFNGTFSEQITLKTTSRLAVTDVDPGPHGVQVTDPVRHARTMSVAWSSAHRGSRGSRLAFPAHRR